MHLHALPQTQTHKRMHARTHTRIHTHTLSLHDPSTRKKMETTLKSLYRDSTAISCVDPATYRCKFSLITLITLKPLIRNTHNPKK